MKIEAAEMGERVATEEGRGKREEAGEKEMRYNDLSSLCDKRNA